YNEWMLALRYVAVLALVFWIGGLVALGAFAAPAAFDVLGPRGADGRALAGAVFGETLRRFHLAAYACAAIIVMSLLVRGVLGPRPRRFAIRLAVTAIMAGAGAWSGLVLTPRIHEAQETLGTSPSTLPEGDPRRVEFGRLHGISTSLQLVPLLGGLALLFFELRD
ncbi:MAG: DUF4149 domain-containing protein, partial [Vicinamibacterales bacterium]